jgi:hypothetical protein
MGYMDKTLKHFGISNEDSMIGCLGRCDNSDFFRKNMGIDWILERHKNDGVNVGGKVRIIIDYDANFPKIVTRVIAQR